MDNAFIVGLIVWYIVFLFSTTLHEASHAFAAALGGDDTAYRAGSATLNPAPHMMRERFGMIVAPVVAYLLSGGDWMIGWASAPFNPYWAARHPRRSFVMSLSGPLSHLAPIAVAWTAMFIGLRTGYFSLPTLDSGMTYFPVAGGGDDSFSWAIASFLNTVFKMNAILFAFNIMPIPPLDGSEIWYLFMKREETRLKWRHTFNAYSFAGLLLAWHYLPIFHNFVYSTLIYGWLFRFAG